MSVEDAFKGLTSAGEEFNPTQIVKLLTEVDKNIAMKTEIPRPARLTLMKTLAVYLKNKNLDDSSLVLTTIIDYLLIYMVSKRRKGREEVIEIIKGIKEAKLSERLLKARE